MLKTLIRPYDVTLIYAAYAKVQNTNVRDNYIYCMVLLSCIKNFIM